MEIMLSLKEKGHLGIVFFWKNLLAGSHCCFGQEVFWILSDIFFL